MLIKHKESEVIDVEDLITLSQFIEQQKAAGKKPCTRPGVYYSMEHGSVKFITIAGKFFFYKNQEAKPVVVAYKVPDKG